MKLNSKYFDGIRVKPSDDRSVPKKEQGCDWSGCDQDGAHPAPKGRGRDGEYFHFCIRHVREYNKSYNYFNGMSDDQVSEYQESALTGHRPTWKMGGTKTGEGKASQASFDGGPSGYSHDFQSKDDFDLFDEKKSEKRAEEEKAPKKRPVKKLELKSLRKLNLDETANADDIKARFKELVKMHHPDLNGGDRGSEDRLREIIQAYNYLKQAGLC